MTQLLAVLVGLVVGFGGARFLRRPSGAAGVGSAARSVSGALRPGREIDLPHLQRSVLSEMLAQVHGRGADAVVPASYRVRLSPDDHATVQQAPGFFLQGLEEAMAAAGRDHGWTVPGRLAIELVADPTRHRGDPAVDTGAALAAPEARTQMQFRPQPATTAPMARLEADDGKVHRLDHLPLAIGRSAGEALRVDDGRVSRHHATISSPAPGLFTVTDDGSSNGTRLNGHDIVPHSPAPLAEGDVIGVGPVNLTFRQGAQP